MFHNGTASFPGDQTARGHVMAWSSDANGNVLGRAHANFILNSRLYQVEFIGGNVTESMTNVTTESMSA